MLLDYAAGHGHADRCPGDSNRSYRLPCDHQEKKPADRDLRNAGLGVIGLLALIIIVPPLAALVLSGV